MSMPLPAPTLDHVVINTRDRLDEAVELYRLLGFTMTPRGHHSLGSMNHLAIFGTEYLELLAAGTGPNQRPDIMQNPIGLNGLVFGTENSATTFAAMELAGVPVFPPGEFSRPVALPEGTRDAVFRTVRLMPGVSPAGRLYFCHHFTRDLVWRDEWRHHANGVTGVARAIIVARDPSDFRALFSRMFGADSLRPIDGGFALAVGMSRFDIVTPGEFQAEFNDPSADGGGRDTFMAALEFRTRSVDAAWEAMDSGDVTGARRDHGRVIVPADAACGATLAFCL